VINSLQASVHRGDHVKIHFNASERVFCFCFLHGGGVLGTLLQHSLYAFVYAFLIRSSCLLCRRKNRNECRWNRETLISTLVSISVFKYPERSREFNFLILLRSCILLCQFHTLVAEYEPFFFPPLRSRIAGWECKHYCIRNTLLKHFWVHCFSRRSCNAHFSRMILTLRKYSRNIL
jgi:hypothetical protein